MKTELEKQLKRYFKDVRGCLLCSTKLSKKFIDDLAQSVDQFVEAQPEADIDAVKKHFGTPEDIAKSFLSETDIGYLRKRLRVRRIIAIVLFTGLALWGAYISYVATETYSTYHGYGVETVIDFSEEEATTAPGEVIIQGESV